MHGDIVMKGKLTVTSVEKKNKIDQDYIFLFF